MQKLLDSIDVSQLMTQAIAFVPKLVTALVLLVIFWVTGARAGKGPAPLHGPAPAWRRR